MLTWVEINKSAIKANLKTFRKIIGKKILLMPVIKSNAYGHGLIEVARICDRSPEVDRLCVVSLDEALQLNEAGIRKPVVILDIYENDASKLKKAIRSNVIFSVYLLEQLKWLEAAAKRVGKKVKVHLKVDTGTSRVGVLPNEAISFAKKVLKSNRLVLEGVWSHFSSSEDDDVVTKRQYEILSDVVKDIKSFIQIKILHQACTASTILQKYTQLKAVRVGIGLYGLHPGVKTIKVPLKPALEWKTKIIQVKTVPKGTKIGYNGTYKTKAETKLAILPVGYADGLPRSLGNNGSVLIHGKKCPIRGKICMNLCMIDVTGQKTTNAGDVAIIIGKQMQQRVSADDMARQAGTINYEIVSRINPTIPRVVIR